MTLGRRVRRTIYALDRLLYCTAKVERIVDFDAAVHEDKRASINPALLNPSDGVQSSVSDYLRSRFGDYDLGNVPEHRAILIALNGLVVAVREVRAEVLDTHGMIKERDYPLEIALVLSLMPDLMLEPMETLDSCITERASRVRAWGRTGYAVDALPKADSARHRAFIRFLRHADAMRSSKVFNRRYPASLARTLASVWESWINRWVTGLAPLMAGSALLVASIMQVGFPLLINAVSPLALADTTGSSSWTAALPAITSVIGALSGLRIMFFYGSGLDGVLALIFGTFFVIMFGVSVLLSSGTDFPVLIAWGIGALLTTGMAIRAATRLSTLALITATAARRRLRFAPSDQE